MKTIKLLLLSLLLVTQSYAFSSSERNFLLGIGTAALFASALHSNKIHRTVIHYEQPLYIESHYMDIMHQEQLAEENYRYEYERQLEEEKMHLAYEEQIEQESLRLIEEERIARKNRRHDRHRSYHYRDAYYSHSKHEY